MPSIAAAEAQLRADNRPVPFLDTCVIVDIIRATMRCMGTNFVQSAVVLRGLLKSAPPGCALAVASMVPTEWGNHAPRTRNEVRGHLAKIQDQAQHFHAACGTPGVGLAYGLPAYPAANVAVHTSHHGAHEGAARVRVPPMPLDSLEELSRGDHFERNSEDPAPEVVIGRRLRVRRRGSIQGGMT
jgi:hypothetical protein